MRLEEHERAARRILAKAGVDSPGLCARVLACKAAGLDRISCILAAEEELAPDRAACLSGLVARRARGEPLAYILGEREFYGLSFRVSEATLTPRPETEMLVEEALRLCPQATLRFADLGCGSGCIGATLIHERPGWHGILADASLPALEIARANAERLGIQADIVQADIFQLPFAASSLDLVVSNPPYIGRQDERLVMWETLAYEPHCALFSEKEGYAHLEAVIAGAAACLKSGGWLVVEHGDRQGSAVVEMLAAAGFGQIRDLPDLASLPRCALGQKLQGEAHG